MKRYLIGIAIVSLFTIAAVAVAQEVKDKMMSTDKHTILAPNDIKWGPPPPSLPPGAQFAVLQGDPGKAGSAYTIRAKFPDGYKVPPHWHPADENVTVLEGTLMMGLGEKFDTGMGHALTAGGFASMPAGVRHFAWSKRGATIQINGIGPFAINYVNPADDPTPK